MLKSGRNYNLRTSSKAIYDELLPLLKKYAHDAKSRVEASTSFQKAQKKVRKIYHSHPSQAIFAVIIIAVSFTCCCIALI